MEDPEIEPEDLEIQNEDSSLDSSLDEILPPSQIGQTLTIIEEYSEPAPRYIEDSSPIYLRVCGECKEKNLIESIHLVSCKSCNEIYCFHSASTVDPSMCNVCCSKVEMLEQTIYKKSEHYNEETDKTYTRTQKARQISFSGEHFLFFNRKIATLTDDELLLAIEYHRAIYQSMIFEREKRRTEYAHRNAGKQFKIPTSVGATSVASSSVTVKKSRAIKPKNAEDLKSILQNIMKSGITPQQLADMLMPKAKV